MIIFFCCIIILKAFSFFMSSSMFSGTTCQLKPNLSLHQPHCSFSEFAESFSQ